MQILLVIYTMGENAVSVRMLTVAIVYFYPMQTQISKV